MTDDMQRAREPKFGDWIRGIYASECNPIRDGIYVRTTRRNHETLYELTDGKGKFWMYPKRSTERLDRPNAFDDAALRLAVPEGWVMVPREPTAGMLSAALIARDERIKARAAANGGTLIIGNASADESMIGTYCAMLAAAPSAEGS